MSYDVEYKHNSNLIGGFLQTSSVNVDPNGKYYTYDGLERLVEVTAIIDEMQVYTESYTYVSNDTNTSSLVATHTVDDVVYAYTYDNVGNITSVKVNGVLKYRYYYDKLGQLNEEHVYSGNSSEVYEYLYDTSGNITTKNHHYGESLTNTDTVTYTYGDSSWGDLLTNYNGTSITYDAIGNPLRWRNGANVEWYGRQLSLFGHSNGTLTTYGYNSDGIRTQKVHYDENAEYVGVTKYTLDGNKIVAENRLGVNIYYTYDDKGVIMGMIYGGESYLFSKNLQGDVIGIYTDYGNLVAKYEYSAFGEITSVTDLNGSGIANVNPFRYRGYYYDTETGFYYLQTRYYDPVVGRFISADKLVDTSSVLGHNLFVYCRNNPVLMADTEGTFPFFAITAAIGAVVGAVVGGVKAAAEGKSILKGAAVGAAVGGLVGAGLGAVASAALAGSVVATTAEVVAGASTLVTTVATGGAGAGAMYIANNLSQAANNLAPATQTAASKMQDVATKGKTGEALSGLTKNTAHIPSLTGTASYRIPDGLTNTVLSEVKNYTGTLSYTNQLKDFVLYAQSQSPPLEMHLYTNAHLSGPLQQIVDSGIIQLFPLG